MKGESVMSLQYLVSGRDVVLPDLCRRGYQDVVRHEISRLNVYWKSRIMSEHTVVQPDFYGLVLD